VSLFLSLLVLCHSFILKQMAEMRLRITIDVPSEECEEWQNLVKERLEPLGAHPTIKVLDVKKEKPQKATAKSLPQKGKGRTGGIPIPPQTMKKGGSTNIFSTAPATRMLPSKRPRAPEAHQKGSQKGSSKSIKKDGVHLFRGTVRRFNGTRGYFFIECPEIHEQYQCDPVCLKDDCPGGVGSQIQFTAVEAEGYKNPVAQNVKLVK